MSLIVVSGGTKGIGRAIIDKFMSQGFDAATCARSSKDLNKMKSELMAAHPNASLYTFQGDMSKKEEVEDFVQFISGISGNVDVLVNNTGIFIPGQVLEEHIVGDHADDDRLQFGVRLAGAELLANSCGMCAGYGENVLPDGAVAISTTARNFKGRMGSPSAQVYLASPYTVAASAVAGRIADPRELLA